MKGTMHNGHRLRDAMTSASHIFDPSILREYDIRGIYGKTLTTADAHAIGAAFGSVLRLDGGKQVAVGWDGRLSSPALAEALVGGLASTGIDVIRIGLGPTPMLYFAVHHLAADGGVMVTGSHNPADYNGFKMMRGTASFWGREIRALGERAAAGDLAQGRGRIVDRALRDAYVQRLIAGFGAGSRRLKVAWDPGNGAMGEVLGELVTRLPGEHIVINATIDGRFPAHHPDPTVPANLAQLRALVARERCDLGIAFDGDGDRIGVVDSLGRIIWGDQLLCLLARDVLAERPGATIIADVKASQVLFEEVARLGGQPLMWKTGHSIIKAKMKETGAPIAGEMSGHIFFADHWYGFDDALYAALRLLSFLARSPASLDALRDELPAVVNTPELRFSCPESRKFAVVEEVRARLLAEGARFDDVDGVRVRNDRGWWLLRASNTQDVLVARCESSSEQGLAALRGALERQLVASGIALGGD